MNGAVAANANVAAPIDAAVAANVGSVDSEATAVADQDAVIYQNIQGSAEANADRESDINQGSAEPNADQESDSNQGSAEPNADQESDSNQGSAEANADQESAVNQ